MAPKKKGIKVSLIELIRETGAKDDFDEATYSYSYADANPDFEKTGLFGKFYNRDRMYQNDQQKGGEDGSWKAARSFNRSDNFQSGGDRGFKSSQGRSDVPPENVSFSRSNLPSRKSLMESEKSSQMQMSSSFSRSKKTDEPVRTSIWNRSKAPSSSQTTAAKPGIYRPGVTPSGRITAQLTTEVNCKTTCIGSEETTAKSELEVNNGDPVTSANTDSTLQLNRFALLNDETYTDEDSEKELNPNPETKISKNVSKENLICNASENVPEPAPVDEDTNISDVSNVPKDVQVVENKLTAQDIQSPVPSKKIPETVDLTKKYVPKPVAEAKKRSDPAYSLDSFVQNKIDSSANPEPASHQTDQSVKDSIKSRYRKTIQEQKSKKLDIEKEKELKESVRIEKLQQILKTKMMYEDVEKTKQFEEFVKNYLRSRGTGDTIESKANNLFLAEDVESLIPSIVMAKAFILEAYQLLVDTLNENMSDLKRMELVHPLALLIKSPLKILFKDSYIENHSLLFLQISQVILDAMNFPKLTSGLALIETIWDSYFFANIVDEATFHMWYDDTDDETPGRSRAIFQILPWFDWLNHQKSNNEIIEAFPEKESEEEDL